MLDSEIIRIIGMIVNGFFLKNFQLKYKYIEDFVDVVLLIYKN